MSEKLPDQFIRQMEAQLPASEHTAFFASLATPAPVSVQVNPLKSAVLPPGSKKIKWQQRGFQLPSRPVFTLDPAFQAGAYYVQEAGSMFVSWLARQLLPLDRPWRILDLCAAPGGKSCLIAADAPTGSLLLSNEVIKSRYQILRYNLAKWGLDNCWTSNLDPERFAQLEAVFDLILVDAPCSGEGLFRKDPAARSEWTPDLVNLCAGRQRRILQAAVPLLKPGGLLVYSTCTYNRQENQAQADYLSKEHHLTIKQPSLPPDWDIVQNQAGYQFFPHRLASEGFFALAAQKTDTASPAKRKKRKKSTQKLPHWTPLDPKHLPLVKPWLAKPERYHYFQNKSGLIYALDAEYLPLAEQFAKALGRLDMGIPLGEIKGKQLIPSAELALFTGLSTAVATFSVDRKTALHLLKKETPPIPNLPKGWHLITYQGHGLLWVKGLGNRYNNYYPSGWRIKMDIPANV